MDALPSLAGGHFHRQPWPGRIHGLAVWTRLGRFRPHATLDLRIDYLRPATPGKAVVGHGECYRITRSISFVRGQAHDGDPTDPLAHVAGTFMFTDAPAERA